MKAFPFPKEFSRGARVCQQIVGTLKSCYLYHLNLTRARNWQCFVTFSQVRIVTPVAAAGIAATQSVLSMAIRSATVMQT
jgi:hypothetical protein